MSSPRLGSVPSPARRPSIPPKEVRVSSDFLHTESHTQPEEKVSKARSIVRRREEEEDVRVNQRSQPLRLDSKRTQVDLVVAFLARQLLLKPLFLVLHLMGVFVRLLLEGLLVGVERLGGGGGLGMSVKVVGRGDGAFGNL